MPVMHATTARTPLAKSCPSSVLVTARVLVYISRNSLSTNDMFLPFSS